MDIELSGSRLLIDPGVVSSSVPDYNNIAAVIVTHAHADHLDPQKLLAIHRQNPSVSIYTVQDVSDELKSSIPHSVVTGGQTVEIGQFKLEFSGGQHALIHSSVPVIDNVGVTVNGKLYYPGDSLSKPMVPVDVLAVPITAPWLKIAEAMDFIIELNPKRVFAVHDALLSDFGRSVNDVWLLKAIELIGGEYIKLKPGESFTV